MSNTNKFDCFLVLIAFVLSFGHFGGALQVSRVLAVLLAPYVISRWSTYKAIDPKLNIVFIGFYVYCLISMIWTPDPNEGLKQLVYYPIHYLLFVEIILFSHYAKKPLSSISWGWLLAVIFCVIIAYWEVLTGNHLVLDKGQNSAYNAGGVILTRFYSSVTFYNMNGFVTFLCFSLPWLFYKMMDSDNRLSRLLSFATIILSSILVFLNASRGGFITLMGMAIIYFSLSPPKRSKSYFAIYAVLFLVLLFVAINYGNDLFAVLINRSANGDLLNGSSRFWIWHNALKALRESYFLGVGIGGMEMAIAKYARGGVSVTHNFFMELLVQYSVVFFSIFLLFLFHLLRSSFKLRGARRTAVLMALLMMPVYMIINSLYLMEPHLYVLFGTIYVFVNYERIKSPYGNLFQVA